MPPLTETIREAIKDHLVTHFICDDLDHNNGLVTFDRLCISSITNSGCPMLLFSCYHNNCSAYRTGQTLITFWPDRVAVDYDNRGVINFAYSDPELAERLCARLEQIYGRGHCRRSS